MSSDLKTSKNSGAKIALGYVRESRFQNGGCELSREIQRALIESACHTRGWQVEIYEEENASGSLAANRPAWNALVRRLSAQDVIAIVATDLSRIHRSINRLNDMLALFECNDLALVLADGKDDMVWCSTSSSQFENQCE